MKICFVASRVLISGAWAVASERYGKLQVTQILLTLGWIAMLQSIGVWVVHHYAILPSLRRFLLHLLVPRLEFGCHSAVMKSCPRTVGHIIPHMPQSISIEGKVACLQMQLHRTRHTTAIFQTDVLSFFHCPVLQIGGRDGTIRKPFRLAGQIVPQMATRHQPGTAVIVQSAVDLVE